MSKLLSTESLHKNINKRDFHGPYTKYRQMMDYDYFDNYTAERQELQDKIIEKSIKHIDKKTEKPWLLFTCGCFGAGKSHSIKYLDKIGHLNMNEFIYIDPDKIKYELPEANHLIQLVPSTAGSLLHKESTYISLLLQYILFDKGYPMIVDGSMKDVDWYCSYINWIYIHYPQYVIGIIKVEATLELILDRCESRGKETGRIISEDIINDIYRNIPQSFEKLKHIVNFYIIIENNENIIISDYKITNVKI